MDKELYFHNQLNFIDKYVFRFLTGLILIIALISKNAKISSLSFIPFENVSIRQEQSQITPIVADGDRSNNGDSGSQVSNRHGLMRYSITDQTCHHGSRPCVMYLSAIHRSNLVSKNKKSNSRRISEIFGQLR